MNRPYIGGMRRNISVGPGGTTAYFGKRSGPTLGSWHQGPTLSAYFWDTTLRWSSL